MNNTLGWAMVGRTLNLTHPLLNVPTTATIINLWDGGQGLVLLFPCGHVAHLYKNEIEKLINEVKKDE